MRGLRRIDSSADLASILDDGTTPDVDAVPQPTEKLTTQQRLMSLIFGTTYTEDGRKESPTARLKLLLISAFLILHALNLCTTLTAKTAITRHSVVAAASSSSPVASAAITSFASSAGSASTLYAEFVDTNNLSQSSSLTPILDKLSALHPNNEVPLVIQVLPPIVLKLVAPGTTVEQALTRSAALLAQAASPLVSSSSSSVYDAAAAADKTTKVASSIALLDRFMSGWTKLVGDPVLSKWIVIVLIVSVFLNGYLLKGIAVGDQGLGGGDFLPSSAPEAAARLLLGGRSTAEEEKQLKMKRRWSGGVEGLSKPQTDWTLADAALMAKERRKELVDAEKERDAALAAATKAKAAARKAKKQAAAAMMGGGHSSSSAAGHDDGSSDESTVGSPLFMSTKKSRTPHPTGRLVGTNGIVEPATPNGMLPLVLTPSSEQPSSASENGKLDTPVTTASETSSEAAVDTPATTVADEQEGNSETPTTTMRVARRSTVVRPLDEIATVFAAGKGCDLVNDEEIILLVQKGKVAAYALEKLLKDNLRAVKIRRSLICE